MGTPNHEFVLIHHKVGPIAAVRVAEIRSHNCIGCMFADDGGTPKPEYWKPHSGCIFSTPYECLEHKSVFVRFDQVPEHMAALVVARLEGES